VSGAVGLEQRGSDTVGSRAAVEGRSVGACVRVCGRRGLGFICSTYHLNRPYHKWTVGNDWAM
jgi:hypothetical protein